MRNRLPAAVETIAVAALLAAGAWLFSGALDTAANYDEGVYLGSLDALRHGQQLGTDVFPDQPPGFYLLLNAAATLFGNSVHGVRLGMLCVSLVGVAAAYGCGRALAGSTAGVGAAALLVIAAPFPSYAPLVEADPPAVALSLVALALAASAYREPERPLLGFLAGAALVAAVSIKLLALAVVLPLAALAVAQRPSRRTIAWTLVGAIAPTVVLLGAYSGSLGALWEGVVTVHREARGEPLTATSNLERVLRFPDLRTPFGWLALGGVAIGVALGVRRRLLGLWPLWTFAAASVALLLYQKPLLDHHLVLLAAALALPCGTVLGAALARLPRPAVAVGAAGGLALVGAGVVQEHRRLVGDERAEPAGVVWAAARVRAATAPSDLVATDLPIVSYRADRRMPGQLIDTSAGRLGSGFLRPAEVLRLIDEARPRAVVVARLFQNYPQLVRGIQARYPVSDRRGGVTIYLPRRAP